MLCLCFNQLKSTHHCFLVLFLLRCLLPFLLSVAFRCLSTMQPVIQQIRKITVTSSSVCPLSIPYQLMCLSSSSFWLACRWGRWGTHTHTRCREASSQPLRHWSIWWTSGAVARDRGGEGRVSGIQRCLEDVRSEGGLETQGKAEISQQSKATVQSIGTLASDWAVWRVEGCNFLKPLRKVQFMFQKRLKVPLSSSFDLE